MVTCDDVIVRTSKRRSGGRKLIGFFVVVLLFCSLTTTIGASGVASTTARPEVDGTTTGAWQSNPEVGFLKRFLVAIIREAMRASDGGDIVLEDQSDPESQLRTLMDEGIRLRGTLERKAPDGKEEDEEDEEEEDEEEEGEKEEGEAAGLGATARGPAAAEVKKSATEVFRDHKLKTLFRWGKRGS